MDASKLESFIRKWGMVVHPNYMMIMPIKICLCKAYDHLPERAPQSDYKEILKKKEILVLELLKVFDVIRPGWNRLRGELLYHHFLSLGIKSSITEHLLEETSTQELLPRFKLGHRKLLKEVIAISALDASKTTEQDYRALSYSLCAAAETHGGCEGGCHSSCPITCPHKNECELKEVEFLIDVMERGL